MTQPFLNPSDVPVFDTTPFGKAICAERGDAIGREDPGYLDLNADNMGDWSWKPNRDFRYGKAFQPLRSFAGSPVEGMRRGPEPGAVFYGVPEQMVDQTTEQFWESSEVSRAEMKRAFLAHLPR